MTVALPKIAHQSSRRRLRLPSNSPPSVARCSCSIFCVLSSSVLQGWLNALLHLPLLYALLHSRRLHPPERQSLDMLYPPLSFPLHTSLHSRSACPNGFSPLVTSTACPCGRWGGRRKQSPSFARMLYARVFCCNTGNIPAFLVVFPPSTVSASGKETRQSRYQVIAIGHTIHAHLDTTNMGLEPIDSPSIGDQCIVDAQTLAARTLRIASVDVAVCLPSLLGFCNFVVDLA